MEIGLKSLFTSNPGCSLDIGTIFSFISFANKKYTKLLYIDYIT